MTAEDGSAVLPEDVREMFRSDPDVEFAVLFGSRVTGNARPSSDVDIGVKFVDTLSESERFQKLCHLSGHAQRSDAPRIDVSDLEELPTEIAHAAVNGEIVCGDDAAFNEFKQEIESEFEDRREDIETHQRDTIRRIADEGLHG